MRTDTLPLPFRLVTICFDLVFPPVCHSCNAPLPRAAVLACPACLGAMAAVDEWDDAYIDARASLSEEGTIREFVAAWYFERDGPLRTLMHRLKYGGMTLIGEQFGGVLGERICGAGLGESDMIVPLPLHASRVRERGFNQCDYIARGVSRITGRPVCSGLVRRTRFTPSQTVLGHRQRRENMRDAFALRPRARGAVEGKTVLLVDDVVTTGSTMRSCAGALRDAGALAVVACAVAIAR